MTFQEIELDKLSVSVYNARRKVKDDVNQYSETTLDTLVSDIRNHGLINPLTVRACPNGKFEILAGQRRYLALKRLGVDKATCRLTDIDEGQAEFLSLSENLQRSKMAQQDKCISFHRLFESLGRDIKTLAKRLSYSEYTLRDYILVHENLAEELKTNLDGKGDEKLSMELAVLLSRHVPREKQSSVFDKIKVLGTLNLKRQAIMEYAAATTDADDTLPDEPADDDDDQQPKEQEPRIKIPREPWIFDEEGRPLIIPKELHLSVLQLVRNQA